MVATLFCTIDHLLNPSQQFASFFENKVPVPVFLKVQFFYSFTIDLPIYAPNWSHCSGKSEHVTVILTSLHWLAVLLGIYFFKLQLYCVLFLLLVFILAFCFPFSSLWILFVFYSLQVLLSFTVAFFSCFFKSFFHFIFLESPLSCIICYEKCYIYRQS